MCLNIYFKLTLDVSALIHAVSHHFSRHSWFLSLINNTLYVRTYKLLKNFEYWDSSNRTPADIGRDTLSDTAILAVVEIFDTRLLQR
jgi:hypothetical protein